MNYIEKDWMRFNESSERKPLCIGISWRVNNILLKEINVPERYCIRVFNGY